MPFGFLHFKEFHPVFLSGGLTLGNRNSNLIPDSQNIHSKATEVGGDILGVNPGRIRAIIHR